MKKLLLLLILLTSLSAESFYYQNGKKVFLKPAPSLAPAAFGVRSVNDITYYENENGQKLGVKNQILVTLKEHSSIESILEKYNLLLVKKLTSTIYLLETKSLNDSVFEKAAALYEDETTLHAEPNFSRKRVLR